MSSGGQGRGGDRGDAGLRPGDRGGAGPRGRDGVRHRPHDARNGVADEAAGDDRGDGRTGGGGGRQGRRGPLRLHLGVRCGRSEARVESEADGIDILVDDVWGGDTFFHFDAPYWETPLEDVLT